MTQQMKEAPILRWPEAKKAPAVVLPAAGVERRSWQRAAIWLVVAAFAVRMAFLLGLQTYSYDRIDDVSRFNETTYIAQWIAEGRGFSSPFGVQVYTGPTAWIPPVHPYLCALVFRGLGSLSQRSFLVILTLQSLFSALTIIPMFGIASRTVGYRAGLWAAIGWAFFPWFSKWAVTWVYETTMSTLLVGLLLWYALYLAETSSRKAWIGFGALWGFALLVNPALLTLWVLSLAWCGYVKGKGQWLKPAIISLVTCLLVTSPWMVRNRLVLGHWVFVRSNFGAEFALGNYHGSLGRGESVGRHPTTSPVEFQNYQQMGDVGYNRWKAQQALRFIRDYPWEFVSLTAKRVVYFWDGSGMAYRPPTAWYWLPWSFLPLSLLAMPVLGMALRRRVYAWQLFWGAFLLYPAPYYLVFSLVRYRHVLEPLLLLLVAYAAVEILGRRLPSWGPERMAGVPQHLG